ncbi:MAG: VTT domain-containing protein [Acidobacteria bacterium]|nr:VTT domain-containing protein [Acidobacteriota bacterium]
MAPGIEQLTLAGRFPSAKRRVFVFGLLAAGLALVASLEGLHSWLMGFLPTAETIIRGRPVLGVLLFVVFAALSAMLAFVSSAVIVPLGVYVWGKTTSLLLLWMGWILGGICAYTLSRYLGRPVVKALSPGSAFERYENFVSHRAAFGLVLLFQLALPSEVPGYLLGFVRYHFWKYLGALALAELPYAVATIYLGASFLERQVYLLVGVGLAVAILSGWSLYTLHRRISEKQI